MDNSLLYWNLRAVEARIDDDNDSTPQTVEELAFCRCVVAMLEGELFNRKGIK